MKKISVLLVASLLLGVAANAQTKPAKAKPAVAKETNEPSKWAVDPTHTSIKFTVSHLTVSEVEGRFGKFDGSIAATSPDFQNAQVNFTVDAASINTENDMRDKHLKSDDFFNAEKYPQMTFTSTSFKKVSGKNYALEGNLTIRDVTKKVKFAVVYGGTVVDPWGNTKAGFKSTGKISRKEFKLLWNTLTEAGGAVVGDEVTMLLNFEFTKAK